MERLHKSMTLYMKAVSKRTEVEDKEKTLPIAYLGGTMINHGDDFELDSEFGQCLISTSSLLSVRLNANKLRKALEELKRGLPEYKRHTLQKRLRAGSNR